MNIRGRQLTFKELLNLVIGRLEFLTSRRRLRLLKTIWVNFRLLPLSQAIKLPIYVYGKLNILSLSGKMVILGPIKRGFIKLGIRDRHDLCSTSASLIENNGTIIIKGKTTFYNGFILKVSKGSTLSLGRNFVVNNNCVLQVVRDVTIGDHVRFAFNVKVMTTDSHFIVDMDKRAIYGNSQPIVIGNSNWLASDVKVFKGTVTPDWTIVTANSILNKDYKKTIPENSIIGGLPVKLIKEGKRRVFSESGETEDALNKYFSNFENKVFTLDDNINLDKYCTE